MSDATKVSPKLPGMTNSRKGKALLLALLNLNIIFVVSVFKQADAQVVSQMITAILFLAGLYVGVQGGIDMTTAWKADTANTKSDSTNTIVTKNYQYKMAYADPDGAEK